VSHDERIFMEADGVRANGRQDPYPQYRCDRYAFFICSDEEAAGGIGIMSAYLARSWGIDVEIIATLPGTPELPCPTAWTSITRNQTCPN
jgi:hypothetical protein